MHFVLILMILTYRTQGLGYTLEQAFIYMFFVLAENGFKIWFLFSFFGFEKKK